MKPRVLMRSLLLTLPLTGISALPGLAEVPTGQVLFRVAVIAEIGSKIVTSYDLEVFMLWEQLRQGNGETSGVDFSTRAKASALSRLIDLQLFYLESSRTSDDNVSAEAIDQQLAVLSEPFGGVEKVEDYLLRVGITLTAMRRMIRENILAEDFKRRRVEAAKVTDRDLYDAKRELSNPLAPPHEDEIRLRAQALAQEKEIAEVRKGFLRKSHTRIIDMQLARAIEELHKSQLHSELESEIE